MARIPLNRLLFGAALSLAAAAAHDQAAAAETVLGWIVLQPQPDNLLTVSGRVYAAGDFEGRYSLTIERHGAGGGAETTQGGAVKIEAGEETGVSTTTVNIAPGDSLHVTLTVFQGERTVSTSQLVVGE